MKIVVCIKQVPGTSQVQIDPVTGVLIRDGRNAKMNPYDLYGLETALRLKEEQGGTITTVAMGPLPALDVLKERFGWAATMPFWSATASSAVRMSWQPLILWPRLSKSRVSLI